jgi:hypothetical protein
MSETVTVTPQSGLDKHGNPIDAGDPVVLPTLAIAPGNTLQTPGLGGDLDDVQFTVFLELGSAIADDDEILVRGKTCRARVQEWRSPWSERGGLVVLAQSSTGKEA